MSEWETAPGSASDGWEEAAGPPAPTVVAPNPSEGGLPFRPFGVNTGLTMPQWISRTAAGGGKALYDVARGTGQRIGDVMEAAGGQRPEFLPSALDISESRRLDAPLMNTGAGIAGNVVGNLAAYAPLAMLPGANTMAGTGLYGALSGAAQPTVDSSEIVKNTMLATALPLGVAATVKGAPSVVRAFTGSKNALANPTSENVAVRNAMDAGYRVTPTQAKPGSFTAQIVEGVSGSAKMEKLASLKNAPVTNRLIREDLGLAAGTKIKANELQALRTQAGKAYEAVKLVPQPIVIDAPFSKAIKNLGGDYQAAAREFPEIANDKAIEELIQGLTSKTVTPATMHSAAVLAPRNDMTASAAVELTKKLRADAGKNIKNWTDPSKQALGYAQRKAADALESLVERNLSASGNKGLVKDWKAARQLYAKTHDVEAALNETTGNVNALHLAKLLDKEKPLTGGMKRVAEFARSFEGSARNVDKMKDRAMFGAFDYMMGIGTPLVSGHPALAAVGVARPALRSAALSRPVQNAMLSPEVVESPAVRNAMSLLTRSSLPASAATLSYMGTQ